MECPRCGREMEEGYLCTEKYALWTREGTPIFRTPKDAVRLRPPGDDNESGFTFPLHEIPHTMLCRACKIVIVPYH